ncbi:MAG: cysteine synthase, partial [Desulfovibrionaceae bacterium]
RVDVFLGSETHRFPHLENLRAIWSVAGVEPKAWLIDQPVTFEDGSMDLDAVEAALGGPRAARLWLLSTSYHRELPCSEAALAMWARNWRRVQEAAGVLRLAAGQGQPAEDEARAAAALSEVLESALEDDLSLHRFWPALFAFAKQVNAFSAEGRLTPGGAARLAEALVAADAVLGVLDPAQLPLRADELPEAAARLLAERDAARGRKDFAASDRLRDELAALGFRVEDGPAGSRVFRIAA